MQCTFSLFWCLVANCVNFHFSHSNGEYVFDHSWADAYYRYGYQYYPKLQSCVPFTPVTGPRILVRNIWCRNQVFDMLVLALKDLTAKVMHAKCSKDFIFLCTYYCPSIDVFAHLLLFWNRTYPAKLGGIKFLCLNHCYLLYVLLTKVTK